MSNIVRIKRRASGAAGAPTSLQNAELAFNEVDNTLYYGKGTGGAGGTGRGTGVDPSTHTDGADGTNSSLDSAGGGPVAAGGGTGNNNPIGIDVKKPSKDTVPFHPYIVIKDGFALLMFMIVFAFFVFYSPNILGHADNYIEANPMVTPAHIVPEWYLLPFYAILRSVPDKLMGVVAMLSAILILAALPWLDTSKIRSAVFRPLYKQFYWILVADVLILGYMGAMPAEGLYLLIARVATAYYFIHFLIILPILGFKEKTIPLPIFIKKLHLRSYYVTVT